MVIPSLSSHVSNILLPAQSAPTIIIIIIIIITITITIIIIIIY